jgi:flagellar motility protein MotE (MotC chaperone)
MRRGIATLLRLRRAERDAKASACAAARAALADASLRRERAAARVRLSQRAFASGGADGRNAGWWQLARVGLVAVAEALEREELAAAAAERAFAQAELEARAAERALRALERLAARIAARERRARARTAQRRLEDIASALRGSALALVAVSALGAQPACAEDETLAQAPAEPQSAAAREVGPELVPLLADLQARHAQLDRRERALADREAHVAELERVAGARLAQAEEIAAAVEQRIEGWRKELGDKSIGRLARVYGGMPPTKAAPLLERFDLDLATRIVAKMKPGQSAALLPLLSPERAIAMSWLVAHPLALRTGGDPSAAEPKTP